MIKNIVFDIGKVILEGSPSSCLKYSTINERDKKIIKEKVFDNPKWMQLDYGYLDMDSYFVSIYNEIPDYLQNEAKHVLINSFKKRQFNIDIFNLMKEFHKNYKIYILSDNNIDTYNYLKDKLQCLVDGWCVSCNSHKTKKDGSLFDELLAIYNLVPEECYFIDDKKENIDKAYKLGMVGFKFDSELDSVEDLIRDFCTYK